VEDATLKIVKIENVSDIDLAALGLIDPKVTVNYIEDHVLREKIHITVPEKVVNIIKCNNPRCVTSIETGAPQIFHLIDRENREYRCEYCDNIISMKGGYGDEFIHKQWVTR
jgi:aspartate carbamoyltransferase regulatory subunit